MTNERTPASDAALPYLWSSTAGSQLKLLLTDAPYSIPDASLEPVLRSLSEQAGIEVTVERLADSGLPAGELVMWYPTEQTGCQLAAGAAVPTAAVLTVWDTGVGYGFFSSCGDPLAGVVVIHRARALETEIGPIRAEDVEALTLLHELGHWFGVPARAYHTSAVDGEHCTNAQCVMFKGSRVNACAVLSNLTTGLPLHFCKDCAEELVEAQGRRAQSAP